MFDSNRVLLFLLPFFSTTVLLPYRRTTTTISQRETDVVHVRVFFSGLYMKCLSDPLSCRHGYLYTSVSKLPPPPHSRKLSIASFPFLQHRSSLSISRSTHVRHSHPRDSLNVNCFQESGGHFLNICIIFWGCLIRTASLYRCSYSSRQVERCQWAERRVYI